MSKDEATALVSLMNAAWSREPIEPATFEVYVAALSQLNDPVTAKRAVEELVQAEDRLPSIAKVRETYLRLRKREVEAGDHQRRELDELPSGPRVLPPEVEEFKRAFLARSKELAEQFESSHDQEAGGACDDCGQDARVRFRYGSFSLCAVCGLMRQRAAARLESDRGRVAGSSAAGAASRA
jgi:hypothetical protein